MPGTVQRYPAHNSLLPFYLAWQMDPNGYNYNLSFSYQFEDTVHVESLIVSLQKLIKLKAYLRQTFTLEGEQLIASIHEDLPAKINFVTTTLNDLPVVTQKLVKEKHNIESESAIKLNIIQFNDNDSCAVVFNIHHILMDGNSLDRFIMDLNLLLESKRVDEESTTLYTAQIKSELPLQDGGKEPFFINYIDQIKSIHEQVDYSIKSHAPVIWRYTDILPNNTFQKLILLGEQENISLFNLLLLAYTVFISKLYNQSAALVDYPVNIFTNKSISGCFINSVTFPLNLEANDTFLSLIHSWPSQIRTLKQAIRFKRSEQLNLGPIPYFAYSDFVQPHDLLIGNKQYAATAYPQMANSNFNFKYKVQKGKMLFGCELLKDVFPEHFTSSLLQRFFNYLDKLLANPSILLSTIDLTFPEEKQKILQDFNNTDSPYPKDKTLVDLFDDIVKQYPDKIAVKAFNGSLTYSELNDKAEQLASFLMEKGTQPEDIVGILVDNRLEMIIAIMAVLKAGAAYLPLADNMPTDYLSYMLEDSNVKYLLTLPHFDGKIHVDIVKINIDVHHFTKIKKYVKPKITPNNLAYIIYTSGTTGKPKGVLLEHSSVVNYVTYLVRSNNLGVHSVGSKYASFSFDASVIEIYPMLLSGGTLCILKDKDKLDYTEVNNFFNQNKVNYAFLPTQFAELFFRLKNTQLQTLIVGGDKLTSFFNTPYQVINAYGPTETTVQTTAFRVDKPYENIPIGKPIDNVKCYVVDRCLNITPIGIVGELLIGGESLARGYLNNSLLTAEKFISNPFQTREEKISKKNFRLYKAGDLVRWLPDGNLEYIGRNDSQVKIRGYRVELGEIERNLLSHPKIKQAVVIIKNHLNGNGDQINKHLVAYYTTEKKIDVFEILNYLESKLPEYMIPSLFIHLDKLPLTHNDKIDKKALIQPDFTNVNNYLAPRNTQEKLVCSAFHKVLGLEKIGVNDDFFSLGGNSIKAITLVIHLQNDFKINVTDVFNLRTPKKIAAHSPLEKDSLRQNLENIKLKYNTKSNDPVLNENLKHKLKKYSASIEHLPTHYEKKSLKNILLTGATGFLGCNLLEQLLASTDYTIFLLIRAESRAAAFERVNQKFKFYFGKKLDSLYNQRLFVFAADIEEKNLGLATEDYQTLASKIDSVIHSAALTKHYGEYDKFYKTNVQGTINLLEFCKLTLKKDFHYISTTSIPVQNYAANNERYVCTEDDLISNFQGEGNPYIHTKYLGEEEVLHYRQQGITSNIYRVGNLAFMASNYCVQENIEDNGFLTRLKCLFTLGFIAEEMNLEEISPADLTAQAVIKLFDKKALANGIYHIFNPNLFNIAEGFSKQGISSLRIVSMEQFIDIITNLLDNEIYQKNIERYLLHQGWLNEMSVSRSGGRILQDRTLALLKKLGFEWPPIEYKIVDESLKRELANVEKN